MKDDLTRRYQFALNPDASEFDAIYVAATLLNPPYRGLLDDRQKLEAKDFLLGLMEKDGAGIKMSSDEEVTILNEQEGSQQDKNNPPSKRFKHLERVSKILEVKESLERAEEGSKNRTSKAEQKIQHYIEANVPRDELNMDPFDHWLKKLSFFISSGF